MGKIRCKFTFHAFPLLYLAFFAPLREEIFRYPTRTRTCTRTARRAFVSISVQVDGIINARNICMIRKGFQKWLGFSKSRHAEKGGNDEINVLAHMCGFDCSCQL